ncbi:MAG: hypothetical protein MHM6MM_005525 [Cercozoa sp. M6MM]
MAGTAGGPSAAGGSTTILPRDTGKEKVKTESVTLRKWARKSFGILFSVRPSKQQEYRKFLVWRSPLVPLLAVAGLGALTYQSWQDARQLQQRRQEFVSREFGSIVDWMSELRLNRAAVSDDAFVRGLLDGSIDSPMMDRVKHTAMGIESMQQLPTKLFGSSTCRGSTDGSTDGRSDDKEEQLSDTVPREQLSQHDFLRGLLGFYREYYDTAAQHERDFFFADTLAANLPALARLNFDKAFAASSAKATASSDEASISSDKASISSDKASISSDKATASSDEASISSDSSLLRLSKQQIRVLGRELRFWLGRSDAWAVFIGEQFEEAVDPGRGLATDARPPWLRRVWLPAHGVLRAVQRGDTDAVSLLYALDRFGALEAAVSCVAEASEAVPVRVRDSSSMPDVTEVAMLSRAVALARVFRLALADLKSKGTSVQPDEASGLDSAEAAYRSHRRRHLQRRLAELLQSLSRRERQAFSLRHSPLADSQSLLDEFSRKIPEHAVVPSLSLEAVLPAGLFYLGIHRYMPALHESIAYTAVSFIVGTDFMARKLMMASSVPAPHGHRWSPLQPQLSLLPTLPLRTNDADGPIAATSEAWDVFTAALVANVITTCAVLLKWPLLSLSVLSAGPLKSGESILEIINKELDRQLEQMEGKPQEKRPTRLQQIQQQLDALDVE